MLPDKLRLEIATPDSLVLTEGVDEVVLPAAEGYMGVRPGHAPLLSTLDVGEIAYRVGGEERFLACSGGFVEVLADSVSILAETAEPAEQIDLERAQRSREKAEKRLQTDLAAHELSRAEVRLKKAISRIRVHSRVQ
jgi:F-type H+-transporting ATPase subunit epsilon